MKIPGWLRVRRVGPVERSLSRSQFGRPPKKETEFLSSLPPIIDKENRSMEGFEMGAEQHCRRDAGHRALFGDGGND